MLWLLVAVLGILAGTGLGVVLTSTWLTPKLMKLISITAERTAALVGATMLNPTRELKLPQPPSTPAWMLEEEEDEDLEEAPAGP